MNNRICYNPSCGKPSGTHMYCCDTCKCEYYKSLVTRKKPIQLVKTILLTNGVEVLNNAMGKEIAFSQTIWENYKSNGRKRF